MPVPSSFVTHMSTALADAGLPPMAARVFSALLAADDGRLTAAELGERLEASAGAVSGAVRYLEQVGMLRRERTPGRRFDTYVVDEDAWHDATLRSDSSYAPMVAALDTALRDLAADDPARRRLLVSREFLVFVQAELASLADRWEARRRQLLR